MAAYAILHRFGQKGLAGTKWQRASFQTIRLQVLKVAGRLEVLKTRVKLHLASALEKILGEVWRSAADSLSAVAEPSALKIGGG